MRRYKLLLLLAAVFAAKLIVLLQLRDHPLLQADTGLDTSVYIDLARKIVAGDTWLGPGLYFVSPLYISEVSPQRIRGGLTSFKQMAVVTGILVAYVVNYLF